MYNSIISLETDIHLDIKGQCEKSHIKLLHLYMSIYDI